jgi:geranylgeranyl diphosphate synthase type II
MDIQTYLKEKKGKVDSALEKYLSRKKEFPVILDQAMRHSLFAGGKRIRPILTMAAFEAMGRTGEEILPFACALEMIHTYSLIHDDLPAIDNDDYRRGKPTCHKAYGEAIAILAGDALLTEGFYLLTHKPFWEDARFEQGTILDIINKVAEAVGILGMVGGQVVDIESEGKEVDLPTLHYIHTHKTGALISVSVQIGAHLGGANQETLMAFTQYGNEIGLAFQIVDDILNVEGKKSVLGKNTGSDLSKGKVTYPSLLGLEESKRKAKESMGLAIDALKPFGPEADPLREIAYFTILRDY